MTDLSGLIKITEENKILSVTFCGSPQNVSFFGLNGDRTKRG